MCRSLDADVKFGVYDKSQLSTPVEHVLLIFPNVPLSEFQNNHPETLNKLYYGVRQAIWKPIPVHKPPILCHIPWI